MIQKHRITTNIGRDQKVNVEILHNYDLMEILSLKFSQKDIYASGACSTYGVVVGRVNANSGYGIPNAKISIFIPQKDLDANDPVISALYPYQQITDKDADGYRYNLLPSRQQHAGQTPTGTFPDQEDILTREEVLEVFENYYSFTVKTNSAGDFMIWGVPVGLQTIHVDIDLSDIGCFSLRPYDFIKKGSGIDNFDRYYKFKASTDLDGLPQIVSFDRSIDVYPFWGSEDLCEIGITRTDFDLSDKGIKIEPISLILVSSVTDDNSDAVKRNGKIRIKSGYKCNLQTTTGKIECVRQTGKTVLGSDNTTRYPELEYFTISEVIDENGVAMAVLPMNMEYVYTNVFGEQEITNDSNKGIPTTAIARFKISLGFTGSKLAIANYLVPNIREYNPNVDGANHLNEYDEGMLATYQFSDVFEEYITVTPPTGVTINPMNDNSRDDRKKLMLGTCIDCTSGVPQDYFYKFIYGKVYTVSSFQGSHYETQTRDAFLGIKQIRPNSEDDCASRANYIPTNFAFRNRTKFSLLVSEVLLFVQYIITIILVKFAEIVGSFFYNIGTALYDIGIGKWRPFRRISQRFQNVGYQTQDRFTKQLPLTIYPDCDECTSDDASQVNDGSFINDYCRVAEYQMGIKRFNEFYDDLGYHYDSRRSVIIYQGDPFTSIAYINQSTDPSFLSYSGDTITGVFPGDFARDNDSLCSGSTFLNFSDLTGLNSQTIPVAPPDYNQARYMAEVYPLVTFTGLASGTTIFSPFVCFFNAPGVDTGEPSNVNFTYGAAHTPTSTFFGSNNSGNCFTYDEWNALTGMDYDNLPSGSDQYTNVVIRIYDRSCMKVVMPTGNTVQTIEQGCDKYDKLYNESISLGYMWSSGSTYYNTFQPLNPTNTPGTTANIASYGDAPGFREYLKTNTAPVPYTNLLSTLIGGTSTKRLPYRVAWSKIPTATYDRKTKSGLSEFRNGVFTIIPVISGKSYSVVALQEWYRRKRVGLFFCGGVVNYSFIDNWLNGLLYFFKFDKRIRWDNESALDLNQRGSKFPRELVFYNVLDKSFYYRSTPYNSSDGFIGQYNSDNEIYEILHPTTFYDVGVRDEFLVEICTDPRVDPSCSVIRDITASSYQDPANIVEYAINYRMDISDAKFDVDDFFSGKLPSSDIKIFDGDITQLMSINCEVGIEGFDLDSPQYFMYNDELMDPENPYFDNYFKNLQGYGPTPIDLKLENNGSFQRLCLNYRLGDYSQNVPFYLWDKGDTGFGPYGSNSDQQTWDRHNIASMKLQRLFSISGATDYDYTHTNYLMSNDPSDEEKYILKPITISHKTFNTIGDYTDSLERFEMISSAPPSILPNGAVNYIEGDLWLKVIVWNPAYPYYKDPWIGNVYVVVNKTWILQPQLYVSGTSGQAAVWEVFVPQTALNYWGNKQVLSTPFLFYFGLRPEKTTLDILVKFFGPKGAFTSTECISTAPLSRPNPPPTPTLSIGTGYSYYVNIYGCSGGICGRHIASTIIYNFEALTIGYYYFDIDSGNIIQITGNNPDGTGSPYYLLDVNKCIDCVTACNGPMPTPLPTPTPITVYYRLHKCIEGGTAYYYSTSLSGSLSPGDNVWGSVECDPNYNYLVDGSTINESDYISDGYIKIDSGVTKDIYGHSACIDCSGNPIAPPTTSPLPAPYAVGHNTNVPSVDGYAVIFPNVYSSYGAGCINSQVNQTINTTTYAFNVVAFGYLIGGSSRTLRLSSVDIILTLNGVRTTVATGFDLSNMGYSFYGTLAGGASWSNGYIGQVTFENAIADPSTYNSCS